MKKFEPLRTDERFFVERLCKCKTDAPCKPQCHQWQRLPTATKAETLAFKAALSYFYKYNKEIFISGVAENDYAFYRIVRPEV